MTYPCLALEVQGHRTVSVPGGRGRGSKGKIATAHFLASSHRVTSIFFNIL